MCVCVLTGCKQGQRHSEMRSGEPVVGGGDKAVSVRHREGWVSGLILPLSSRMRRSGEMEGQSCVQGNPWPQG